MDKIYQITPMDSKGEQDGNLWWTSDQGLVMAQIAKGHAVKVMEGHWHKVVVTLSKAIV